MLFQPQCVKLGSTMTAAIQIIQWCCTLTGTHNSVTNSHWLQLGNIFAGPRDKLLFSFMVISYIYRFFIPTKTTCTGLVGIINATVYKTEAIVTGLGHG